MFFHRRDKQHILIEKSNNRCLTTAITYLCHPSRQPPLQQLDAPGMQPLMEATCRIAKARQADRFARIRAHASEKRVSDRIAPKKSQAGKPTVALARAWLIQRYWQPMRP
jgi:hypothetical protein